MFQWSFKVDSGKFQGYFKEDSRVFQGKLRGDSRVSKRSSNGVKREFGLDFGSQKNSKVLGYLTS